MCLEAFPLSGLPGQCLHRERAVSPPRPPTRPVGGKGSVRLRTVWGCQPACPVTGTRDRSLWEPRVGGGGQHCPRRGGWQGRQRRARRCRLTLEREQVRNGCGRPTFGSVQERTSEQSEHPTARACEAMSSLDVFKLRLDELQSGAGTGSNGEEA